MKKYTKILTLILSALIIITAFTAVSLATEGTGTQLKPLSYKSPTWSSNDFETYEGGYAIDDDAAKPGKVTIVEQDNGNKMALMEYAAGTGSTVEMWDFSATYDEACNIVNYEYFAIEFDIMTLNGTYDGTAIYSQVQNGGTRISFLTQTKFTDIGLSTTPYTWNHLTIVVRYNGNNTFTQYAYVNGKLAKAYATVDFSSNATWKALDGDYSSVRVRDFRAYPDAYPNPESQVALDNFRFTYYPNNYLEDDLDAIANYNFGEDYVFPYKYTVATLTDKETGNVTYFDDFAKAFEAAKDSDTLTLFEDVAETYMIDKAITVDTAGFAFNWESRTGYYAETAENVLTFTKAENAVTVIWDPECADACDCYFGQAGHIMGETSVYAPGVAPKYYGKIPSFEIENGLEIEFLGWTYEKGGTEVQDLTAVTPEQAETGTLYIYPVYRMTQYAAEIIASDKTSSHVLKENLAAAFAGLADGATMRLWSDYDTTSALTFSNGSKNVTLDLNGFNVYRFGTAFTDYSAVLNAETGEYEKGEALESPEAIKSGSVFSLSASNTTFNLISSRAGAEIYSVAITANRLILEGDVVANEITKTECDGIFSVSGAYTTINVLGKNLTAVSNYVIYAEHGGGSKTCSFNIDGGTYIKIPTSTTGMFHILRGGTHTVKNALLIANGSYCGRTSSYNEGTSITFENCDIINAVTDCLASTDSFIFKDCRVNSTFNLGGTVTFDSGTRLSYTVSGVAYAENTELIENSKTFTYTYATSFAVDPITLLPYASDTSVRTTTFNYLVLNPETDLASVTWKDFNGNTIKTETLLKGEKADAPLCKLESADGWRSAKVTSWLDANQNEFNLVITDENEQVYTAVRPEINEDTVYVANVSEAHLNFSYVAQFHMYFYLPVTEGMERPVLTGAAPSSSADTALINGQNYWVYTWWCSAPTVADNTNFVINFEIDGVKYTQNFTISALIYAEIVLADPDSEEEALAVANMVRYIKEARIASNKVIGEKFDELIGSEGLYPNLPDYLETYPDDSLDTSAIAPYVEYFTLSIKGTPCYTLRLSQHALDLGMTKDNFELTTKDGVRLGLYDYAKNGKDFDTNNTKIYDLIKTFTVTVKVPAVKDSETGEVITEGFTVSSDYSIGSYIKGAYEQNPEANLNLAKAAYSFALSVSAYRDSVTDY